uniref:N-glycosylase/DNA lyase n=1 Tax=Thermofilum pendens TaxID=2269 RepID=A0A7C3WQQ9_THEPE
MTSGSRWRWISCAPRCMSVRKLLPGQQLRWSRESMRGSSSSSKASHSKLRPDEQRAVEVGRALATPGLVEHLAETDPQMSAVRRIVKRLGFPEGALYVVGVSLLSYMLSERGEKHWDRRS